jgi:hypothetical protein
MVSNGRIVVNSKFWVYYRSLRLALEVFVMLMAAALCSYLILRTQG